MARQRRGFENGTRLTTIGRPDLVRRLSRNATVRRSGGCAHFLLTQLCACPVVTLLVGALVMLVPLAHASPPDPTWIAGLDDEAGWSLPHQSRRPRSTAPLALRRFAACACSPVCLPGSRRPASARVTGCSQIRGGLQ